ncbi:DNA-binding IclR family transcriptional regulator [Salibacterium salarium]|uniref:Glycerol operon regulatory protein n=1 Tax=Salibacterium salarium TaxID=284579 RepID=A0A428NA52_9BACI|nr:IclR family transcriptional regulator [Salibacterium salarium]MDQ0298058.1 DNA-binding IclR family transcriptional regulator [Salibacterium salarium]RSL35266.1 IclR family transcriptional regulator [Salibacterium salarium]
MPIIQSVDRALSILDLFDESESELKITDISEKMMLHKSTVHSLLKTLEKHQYVEQDEQSGKYRLGMKLFERGHSVIRSRDIRGVAKDFLYTLSKDTGQTVHLVIQDGKEGVYIDKVESASATVLYSRIGRRIPLHCSGVGKALIAFQSDQAISFVLDDYEFVRRTEHTITTREGFWEEIKRVREKGYAEDLEENEPGVRCVAIPVRDHTGNIAAALSISTFTMRTTDDDMRHYVNQLKEAGKQLSQKLGYGV